MRRFITLVCLFACASALAQTRVLERWRMESSLSRGNGGESISSPLYDDSSWHSVTVPTTVLRALVDEGLYPDPRFGMDNYLIPDISDEFNERVAIHGDNIWKDPWWFRTTFTLPDGIQAGKHVWLHLDGINYRADVWMNGRKVASKEDLVGMFRRFPIDISRQLLSGENAIGILIYPPDHPGTPAPGTQKILFGPNRGTAADIFRDETLKFSGGWDCAPVVRDRNMGLWQKVWLSKSGEVTVEDPFIRCEVPSEKMARLFFSTSLENHSSRTVRGTVRIHITHLDSLDMGSWTKYTPGDFDPLTFEAPVTLKPREKREVSFYPKEIANPLLWWPNGFGQQHLHHARVEFICGGTVSDSQEFDFGIRQVDTRLMDKDGEKGLVFLINGRKIFCRGGWLQPDILLGNTRENIYDQARLLAEANVNLIGSEDMPSPCEDWLDSWDRYGLMDWHVFYQCYRMYPGRANAHNPDDHSLAVESARDMLLRYRNHPCIVAWFGVNEVMVDEDIYLPTKAAARELDPSRPFIPTTSTSWDVEKLTPWILPDLPTGTTDDGAPDYGWAPSEYYFRKVDEVYLQMFRNEMGMPGMPVYESLEASIPTINKPFDPGDRLFPLDSVWAEHGAWDANNFCYRGYDSAIRTLYGDPASARDYVRKGQMVSAEGYRAMYEAAGHRMWDVTTGAMLWKLNSCWPDVCWQIYDWFLAPNAAYYFSKKALEPLHIQMNADDNAVCVVNAGASSREGLRAQAVVVGADMKERWRWSGTLDADAGSMQTLVTVPFPRDVPSVYLVRLSLEDAGGNMLSENLYWRYTQHQNFYALTSLPEVDLHPRMTVRTEGRETVVSVDLCNDGDTLAFFRRVVLRSGEDPLHPVFWDDNYITLFPGESRTLTARVATKHLQGPLTVTLE